jgi:hypothetical protein
MEEINAQVNYFSTLLFFLSCLSLLGSHFYMFIVTLSFTSHSNELGPFAMSENICQIDINIFGFWMSFVAVHAYISTSNV